MTTPAAILEIPITKQGRPCRLLVERSPMTTYYSEGVFGVVSFFTVDRPPDSTPTRNSGALTPRGGSTAQAGPASGPTCFTASISTPSPPTSLEEMQTRCRDLMARRAAPGSTSGYTPRPRPSRRGDGTLPIRASEPLAREATVPMTTSYKEAFWIVSFETDPQTTSTPTPSAGIRPATSGWIVRARPGSRGRRAVERRLHPDPGGFGPRDAAPLPRPF